MFTLRLSEITFETFEEFCRQWAEGVRVEYKKELDVNIPKTVSAFANTLGGIFVMGVATESKSNKPLFPIEGLDRATGIEEKIIQASTDGIYPALVPDVRILDVPNRPSKVVVVVKVNESAEAPHAIQNSTRVYVRTGNTSKPYELAEIDRMEYLLKRRQRPEAFREDMIIRAEERVKNHVLEKWRNRPSITVIIARRFPREPLLSLEQTQDFIDMRTSLLGDSILSLREAKRNPTGMFGIIGQGRTYAELNHYGMVLSRQSLETKDSRYNSELKHVFLRYAEMVWTIGRSLTLARDFFRWAMYSGDLQITVKFDNVFGKRLIYTDDDMLNQEFSCSEQQFSFSEQVGTETLNQRFRNSVLLFTKPILWAFNCDPQNNEHVVADILTKNNLG